jgi:predicted GNAT family acetyltransferase
MDIEIEHETTANRYVGRNGDEVVCSLDYAENAGVVAMTHTYTNPAYRGQGLAGRITEHAVAETEAAGKKVRAMCWYVAKWFDEHPEKAHLLA